jgi:hypothetical protein
MVDTRAMQRMGLGGAGAGVGGGCNTLSFIGVPVHTGGAAPLVRLASVAATLSWIRGSLAVLIAVLIPPVLQFFLRDIALSTRLIMWMLPAKATLGFSNMRGPVKPVALRGFPVERMYNGGWPGALDFLNCCESVEIFRGWAALRVLHGNQSQWGRVRGARVLLWVFG